tara:strand:+ start:208 stop:747 length:540 start_codon:yes stop_codon:yes gene_type:complete
MNAKQVIEFWFEELQPKQWWMKDLELDQLIQQPFGDLHAQACQCELWEWRDTPQGRLAEIIVLDQFSRNIYRDTPKAFASDPLALALSQQAVQAKDDQSLNQQQRAFLYMPYMHSESASIHGQAVQLFTDLGNPDNLEFEHKHKAIIDRFGRYPHRNAILGRASTDEEIAFLKEPGSSF